MRNNWTDSIDRKIHIQELKKCKRIVTKVELDKINENKTKDEQKSFSEILENARKSLK